MSTSPSSALTELYTKYVTDSPDQSELIDLCKAELLKLFTACPDLKAIALQGYTPGFNDGDPCYHIQGTGFVLGDGISDDFDMVCDIEFSDELVAKLNDLSVKEQLEGEVLESLEECSGCTNYFASHILKLGVPIQNVTRTSIYSGSYNSVEFPDVTHADGDAIRNILDGMDHLFRAVFDTNYLAFITLKDGEVVYETEEYDVGY